MLDVGANVDCSPKMLAQFAVMGSAYARLILKIPTRAWACFRLAKKNTRAITLTREAFPLLQEL